MRTIVALGNPGPEYDGTRHNAGFVLADHLAAAWNLGAFRREGPSRVARGKRHGIPVQLIKPQTFMNRSGVVFGPLLASGGFEPARDLLVLVDDVALPLGTYRLRAKGSPGGHNGLKSVEAALRSPEYPRLRIGVGPLPPEYDDMADYVLEPFTEDEASVLHGLVEPMAGAVECWLDEGIEIAMTRFNAAGAGKRDRGSSAGDPEP